MGIKIRTKGDFKKTERYLKRAKHFDLLPILNRYGEIGVQRLMDATPKDSGLTAASWWYSVDKTKDSYELHWNNSNITDGVNVALIIQLGHATTSGTYVKGVDYINPAMRQVFEDISTQIWKEVK